MDSFIIEAPEAALDRAIQDHQAGETAMAEAAYRRILVNDPRQPDAMHLLGMLACDRGDTEAALPLIDAAIGLEPGRAAFHNTRGRVLSGMGWLSEAEAAYRKAWELRPCAAEIANNLGCLLRDRGQLTQAVTWFIRARSLAPYSVDVDLNLADALAAQGEHDASLEALRHALSLQPDLVTVHYRLGRLQQTLGQHEAAAQSYRTALLLAPDHAASHNNLGLVWQALGQSAKAARCFRDALLFDARCADAHYNLGCLLAVDNRLDEARRCHDQALAVDPLHGPALWARCMVELPTLYDTAAEIPHRRERYAEQLAALARRAQAPEIATALRASAGSSQPFFLPYQGHCDRELQALYGGLLARVSGRTDPPLATWPTERERIRIGIVSGFFCDHTVWRLMLEGWLGHIDRASFDVFAYHTGGVEDECTARARGMATRFASGEAVRPAIVEDAPHVLIYPELGMDPGSARLAAERLAPVQCVGWGQPQTSGLPTMDYFLSSAAMEPREAAAHYTERLVLLPGLGVHYTPEHVAASGLWRPALGLRQDAVVFWCGQALWKYLPQHDDVFARIAEAVPNAQFLFIAFGKSAAVTAQFRARLARAFAARGLDAAAHCVMLDPMPQTRFLGSLAVSDLVLDSIGWSGGRSTLDALAVAPVIITVAGPLMRGRHTAAILSEIGVPETIARTTDEYVGIAIRLAHDPAARTALRVRVAAGRQRVMADRAAIVALEDFVRSAVAEAFGVA